MIFAFLFCVSPVRQQITLEELLVFTPSLYVIIIIIFYNFNYNHNSLFFYNYHDSFSIKLPFYKENRNNFW